MPRENIAGRVARHEALHAKLETLLTQVAAVAKSKPGEAVAPIVLALAGDLLFEAREFRPRGERRGLPGVAPDHAGLAVQLGQALAMLDIWSGRVAHTVTGPTDDYTDEEVDEIRAKLAKRVENLVNHRLREIEHAKILPSNQQVDESYPRVRTAG